MSVAYDVFFIEEASYLLDMIGLSVGAERKRNNVVRRIPSSGDYIPVTATDGVKSGYMSVTNYADVCHH